MRYHTIEQASRASEAARTRDTYAAFDGDTQPVFDDSPLLSDKIRAMDAGVLRMDGGDLLLYDLPITTVRLRELLADAQEQLEAYPGESSAYFHACAGQITRALLGSLQANAERL